jgi:hypothetical protein
MPIPPSYTPGDFENHKLCSHCRYLRTHNAGRVVCLKYLAYVGLWNTCDDWELGKEELAKFGLQRTELDEEEKRALDESQLIDLREEQS